MGSECWYSARGWSLRAASFPPSASSHERCAAGRLSGRPSPCREAVAGRAALVVAASDPVFGAQLERVLREAGCECEVNDDVVGVQLAGCAKNAAALAAGIALSGGANDAGAAAARVFAECHLLARTRGADSASFIGVAGTGDLVAAALSPGSRNRRAGELLGAGMDSETIERVVGQAAEALDFTPTAGWSDAPRRHRLPSHLCSRRRRRARASGGGPVGCGGGTALRAVERRA